MKTQKLIVFLLIMLISGTASAQYDFQSLFVNPDCDAGICSFGRGINDRGDVVGWGVGGEFPGPKGFKLNKHGKLTVIEYPGAAVTQANGINDSGDIVGLYVMGGPPQSYLRKSNGTYSDIVIPGSTSSQAWGINSRGQVVGQYDDSDGTHGYVWNPGGSFESFDFPEGMIASGDLLYTRFRDINDHGQIVGYYRVTGGAFLALEVHGFLLDKKGRIVPIDFPVGPQTTEDYYINVVHGINNKGIISGGYVFADTTVGPPLGHGFVRSPKGVFTTVDFPSALQTEVYKVSDKGVLVGGAQDPFGISRAFVASPN